MSRFAGRRPYQFQNADVASYSLAGFGVKIPNIPPSAADDPGSPEGLARGHTLQPTVWPGVYDLPWGTPTIRLIVLNTIEPHPRNAAWELFSTQHDRIRQGAASYRPRRPGTWDLLYRLYLLHLLEDPSLATTIEEYVRDLRQQFLHRLTPEEQQAVLDQ